MIKLILRSLIIIVITISVLFVGIYSFNRWPEKISFKRTIEKIVQPLNSDKLTHKEKVQYIFNLLKAVFKNDFGVDITIGEVDENGIADITLKNIEQDKANKLIKKMGDVLVNSQYDNSTKSLKLFFDANKMLEKSKQTNS
ncbi:MAG: hypothetical protein HQL29_01950 [Candidatus Omnitrophica bacterium]|nr:hypothetical protein [Candidatus Omnitrophota bacterium]